LPVATYYIRHTLLLNLKKVAAVFKRNIPTDRM
jgi:hypothetical protein